jgi:hypothetical protein
MVACPAFPILHHLLRSRSRRLLQTTSFHRASCSSDAMSRSKKRQYSPSATLT